jgi:hypothetical protein
MNFSRSLQLPVLVGFILLGATLAPAQSSMQTQPTMQTWLMLNPYSQETLLVTDLAEQSKLQVDGWKINGTGFLCPAEREDTVGVRRLVRSNDKGNDRVFAIYPRHIATCLKSGYNDEGILGFGASTQLEKQMIPVYRFSKENRHLWLIGKSDRPWVEERGWKYDGVAFWIWPAPAS